MYNASIAFQVLPKTKDNRKTLQIIDKVIHLVDKSKVSYTVGPMETTMEGDLTDLLEIVKKAQNLCIKEGAESVFTNVKIMYSPKGVMTIEEKLKKYSKK